LGENRFPIATLIRQEPVLLLNRLVVLVSSGGYFTESCGFRNDPEKLGKLVQERLLSCGVDGD